MNMDYLTDKFSLDGKVALITGASYGIGFAMAKGMAAAGATIVFNDIKQELVDKGIASYKEEGIDAHGYVCDVTNEAAVNEMVARIESEVGVIDILVNNAGIIKRIPMCDMTAEQFRQVIDVDLNAPFIVSKAVIPSMIKKGHGKIINICSMMSELGRETVSAYAAAKGGLKMLTRNIASEYGEFNIQCNGIGPGYIATPQTAPLREAHTAASISKNGYLNIPASHGHGGFPSVFFCQFHNVVPGMGRIRQYGQFYTRMFVHLIHNDQHRFRARKPSYINLTHTILPFLLSLFSFA